MYVVVRGLVRFLIALFYERVDVVGAENIPAAGPLIVAANHHNSLVDAMLLIAVVPRRLRTLANAPLFLHPLIGPFLRLAGALPVHRRQEAGDDPTRNAALFAATTATLRAGGAILIFPEGRTQPEPVLLALRTGAARMLLAAELGDDAPVTLLPVGLVFHEPGTFRTGRALVLVGRPVPTDDVRALAATAPEEAGRRLTERLGQALRGLIVEADDWATLRLLALVEELWQEEAGPLSPEPTARVGWRQRAMHTYLAIREREPVRLAAFRRDLEGFASELERAGIAARQLSHEYSPAVVARRAFPEGRIGDRLHDLTASLHDALLARPRWADRLLVATSGLIDLLGLFLIAQGIFGPSIRPLLGLLVLFTLRQACQALCALPSPPGMIWRNPGFPSLLVTYGTATDLFFSGHTAIAVYGSLELAHTLGPAGTALGVLVTVLEVTTVIVLRAHYTMDVFAGAVTALWVGTVVSGIAPRLDAVLLDFAHASPR